MKRIIATALLMLAYFASVYHAQAQKPGLRVAIPFSFSAAGTQMPAGIYTIKTVNGFAYMGREGAHERWMFVNAIPTVDEQLEDNKLVFSVQGGQHFLKKILCPSLNVTLEFSSSKAEMKARQVTPDASGS